MLIYIILVIVLLIIFLLYLKKKDYKNNEKSNEFFPFNNDDYDKPEYVKNYENNKTDNSPNYTYENITQYNFKRFLYIIKNINKEKIHLKNKSKYNFYTQSTTDDKIRMDLDIITKYVLLKLNDDKYYDFSKTNYGDVEIWIDKKGNEEIKYELFLWDKKNFFEVKLHVYIIKFVEKNNIEEYGIKDKKYIFEDYNIGLPFKDQIIPLPTEVIITAHIDTGLSTIKPNEPSKIKYLYLNQIEIQNSTLIVNYQKDKYPFDKLEVEEDGFSGITDMSLEYMKIKKGTKNNPYFEKARKYNQWPRLDEEPQWKSQFPSKPPPKHWDVDGVYYYGNDDKKPFTDPNICKIYEPGTRWSSFHEDLQPYYWPTLATLPRNCGDNYWLFDITSGPVGNNTFIGGGKR